MATICYVEIPAPDAEAAAAFYRQAFGWTVTPSRLTEKPYQMFSTGEGQLEGGLDPSRKVSPDGILLHLKVTDMTTALEAVRRAGGRVVEEKAPVGGEHGFSATIADPNGNRIGLWSDS